MNIYFKIKNQQIERLDNNKLVEKSREYVNAFFIFSEDWQNHKKTITFTSKENNISYNVELVEDNCLVPWEVITPAGFTISGFGEDESFITLNKIEIDVDKSGLTEDGEVPGTPTPTQWEKYKEEIEEIIDDLKENPIQGSNGKSAYEIALDNGFKGTEEEWLESLKGEDGVGILNISTSTNPETGETWVFIDRTDGLGLSFYIPPGEQGPKGEKGDTPVRGTDYWTEEDKAEIKGYVDEAILGGAW